VNNERRALRQAEEQAIEEAGAPLFKHPTLGELRLAKPPSSMGGEWLQGSTTRPETLNPEL